MVNIYKVDCQGGVIRERERERVRMMQDSGGGVEVGERGWGERVLVLIIYGKTFVLPPRLETSTPFLLG